MVLCLFALVTYILLSLEYNHKPRANVMPRKRKDGSVILSTTEDDPVTSVMQDIMPSSVYQKTFGCNKFYTWAKNFSMSRDFKDNVEEFLSAVRASANVPRNLQIPLKTKYLYRLSHYLTSKLKFIRTVCETGKPIICLWPLRQRCALNCTSRHKFKCNTRNV